MGLADDLFEANQSDFAHPLDELGLAQWNNVDYYVARALAIQQRDRESPFTTHQLHLRDGQLYYGAQPVQENSKNLYYYAETGAHLNTGEQVLFWKKLKACLPRLDKSIVQISPHLFWDKSNGAIIDIKEIENRYGKRE